MNGQLLEEINSTMFTSSKEGRELITELTRKAGFSSENIISRLAIARSLQENDQFKYEYAADSRGKQIRGKTLLGKKETALVMLAMLLVKHGELIENEDLKTQIRLHWERGLRLIKRDLQNKELSQLILFYAQNAALSANYSDSGLGTPQAKLKESIVGQQLLKNQLLNLQDEIIENQESFSEVISLIGSEGVGKTHIINEFANSLGLEVLNIEKEHLKNTSTLISHLKSSLQQKGVLFTDENEIFTIPKVVISIENFHQLEEKEVEMIKHLRPMPSIKNLSGGSKLKFPVGALFISSQEAVEWTRMFYLEPYSRAEISQIIRRSVQGGTEEVRKYIALSGRLNPKLSIKKMQEAITFAKSYEKPKPLSEAVIFDLMDNVWKTNKVGLSKADIELLQQIENGALPNVVIERESDLHFFVGQRFINLNEGNIEVSYERIRRILEAEKLKEANGNN